MKRTITMLGFMVLFMLGCGTTYLKNSSNVSKTKKKYDKILVVARSKEKLVRFRFEDQVVNDLAAQGVIAKSSKDIIRTEALNKDLSEGDMDNLRSKLVEDGYSGVIVTNLVNTSEYTDVLPGGTGTAYYPVRYGRFGRYYRSYPVNYWEPDQVETGIEYTLESCLYDLSIDLKDNLQWVGRFQVKDPSSLTKTIEKYSKELTTALIIESISQE